MDELAVAGNISGAPIAVIKCETSYLNVPASSEIVIEGEFILGTTEPEGPFGEFTGYMTSSPRGEPTFPSPASAASTAKPGCGSLIGPGT